MNTKQKVHWPVFLFITIYHILLIVAIPLYLNSYTPSTGLLVYSGVMMFVSGLGVTAGYHRLMSHCTYKTTRAVEAVLLFFASVATQGSALRWCYDHRMHHSHVDTDEDPYSIKKGFWHAHIIWMFFRTQKIDMKAVSDLNRSPLIRLQHKYYITCFLVSNFVVIAAAALLFNDWWGAFVWAGLARLFVLHHLTWFINSLAHTWGSQNYSREHSAVDSYLLCLLTFGEGYHNYHHTFPQDFRNGIRWYHFDPTKWLIWSLSKMGLAWNLKRVNDVRIFRQLVQDHAQFLIKKIESSYYSQREFLEKRIEELKEALIRNISNLHQLLSEKSSQIVSRSEIKELKKTLRTDWRSWKILVRSIEKNHHLPTA